ncbi:MAG: histidine kinase dimerization/phosphoacceptor domain -containing protein [Hyphomonadaceae bacterium]
MTALVFALVCSLGFIAIRAAVDAAVPGSAPFALCYPIVLIATLFAGQTCGFTTLGLTLVYAWYFVLPVQSSFTFSEPTDLSRTIINAFAASLVVLVTQAFRRSAREARQAREQQLAERELFLRELDHRVANNFTTVSALLHLQRRRTTDEGAGASLDDMITRVDSIARAHRHLYASGSFATTVDMAPYLGELCSALNEGLFKDRPVTVSCDVHAAALPRDRAVTLGIIVNELVTNAAKHAFPDGAAGAISVHFEPVDGNWRLRVRDTGRGIAANTSNGGFGRTLLDGLARQAGARMEMHSAPGQGAEYTFTLERD